ncbi:zinc finger BED domain-containing protein RICESLEEPER 2-like [Apium graveolens]|uniref:zinc finger BED domain-containing protein RICESLEEPER 2-like n=1 Tax=Apium graveolens TaxID=4045 RepID=UPI003D7A3165
MSSDFVSSPIENGTGNQNQNHSGFHTQEAPIANETIRKRDIDQSTGSTSLVVQYIAKKVRKKKANLKGYMTITAHYVDPNWKLQKRVINFCHIPPPHTGLMISDAIFSCLNAWGIENKISNITLDNASSNDSAVRHLKDSFSLKGNLYFGGKIFHVRCCAHVLNLMVQDGLGMIGDVISNVRDSVKYLKGSPSRLHRFNEIARQCQLSNVKKLMDPLFHSMPSEDDWEKIVKVIRFLEVFHEATTIFSGYEYPTSNIFLPEIWKIKELLLSTCVDDSEFMRNMAMKMKVNFDKYWSEYNLLMAIASVLDLRYKMYLIHLCFPKIYLIDVEAKRNADLVVKTLHELYTHYAANHCKGQSSGSLPATSCVASAVQLTGGLNMTKNIAEFNSWAQGIDHVSPLKSDIDVYLEEGRYI